MKTEERTRTQPDEPIVTAKKKIYAILKDQADHSLAQIFGKTCEPPE